MNLQLYQCEVCGKLYCGNPDEFDPQLNYHYMGNHNGIGPNQEACDGQFNPVETITMRSGFVERITNGQNN